MKNQLNLPLLFVVVVVIGCGKPVAHYEIDTFSAPAVDKIEREQIRLQARQHAAEDHKQKRKSKKQDITVHPPMTPPSGGSIRIPSHRLTTYSIKKDSARALIYYREYATEIRRLEKFATQPRVIALVCLACLAIAAIIVSETR